MIEFEIGQRLLIAVISTVMIWRVADIIMLKMRC